jgi:hypothetical protein
MLQQTLDALVGAPDAGVDGDSSQHMGDSDVSVAHSTVSVSDETEACSLLLHKCVMHSVAVLSARLSRAWSKQMLAVDWANLDAVGDVSHWMSAAITALKDG